MQRERSALRARLWRILEGHGTVGRLIQASILLLVAISLVLPVLETLESMRPYRGLLHATGWTVALLFTIDYGARVFCAPNRLGYVRSAAGIVDLLAILPFIVSLGMVDSQALRLLRMLRILHAMKVARYSRALQNLRSAFDAVRAEMVVYAGLSLILLYVSSLAIYHFEREAQPDVFGSVFDALWWSAVTLSTVGYGDVYPITTGGRLFSLLVIITGIGVVSVPSSLMAAALVRRREDEQAKAAAEMSLPPDLVDALDHIVQVYRRHELDRSPSDGAS